MNNFLVKQYKSDSKLLIKHNYLKEQFSDYKKIFSKIEKLIQDNQFTLGSYVDDCERLFAKRVGAKYAIGVGSGTDALFLTLKSIGVKDGDEVITTPFTFYATVGAIVTAGAKPVFVDIKGDYNIDENLIEKKISKKTKAIIPVHWAGRPCEMKSLVQISKKYNLHLIQDACHAIDAKYHNKNLVNYGGIACYSMHPLKNLNVWGDGGFVATNSNRLNTEIRLLRNHGLIDRDRVKIFGYNSRLDSIQAIVAEYFIKNKLSKITKKRISNSKFMDSILKKNKKIFLPKRRKEIYEVFHLYQFLYLGNRDKLVKLLKKKGIDAKIHYPIPMHLQRAAKKFLYKKGDFPVTEDIAKKIISLPVHEFVNLNQLKYMANTINEFKD